MTLANAIARVRSLLHEPTAKMWSDAEITTWLNDGQRAMCVRRGIEEIWTDELTAETSSVMDPVFLSIYKIVLEGETLKRYAYKIFHNTVFFVEDYTETPKALTGTLEVYGTRMPVDAATTPTAVDFEIPDAYMNGPIFYAMEMANMKDENYAEAQIYVQLFASVQKDWETSRKYATTNMTAQWM